jgi:hypothetical protein
MDGLLRSRGLVKLETNSRVPNINGPSTSARVSYSGSHELVYPLGLSHPVANPLVDRAVPPMTIPAKKPMSYKM